MLICFRISFILTNNTEGHKVADGHQNKGQEDWQIGIFVQDQKYGIEQEQPLLRRSHNQLTNYI